MNSLLGFAAALLLLVLYPLALVGFGYFVLRATCRLVRRRGGAEDQVSVARLVSGLVGLFGVLAAPVAAARIAEGRSGWVDADGNGMQDPFVNGRYDWLDTNGDAFVAVMWLLLVVTLVVVYGLLWITSRKSGGRSIWQVPQSERGWPEGESAGPPI